ncbi:uncharacterized protein LOC129585593 [Paramacrobiotus metropolitanus]|uniref:uncharacterized protein LOC129585593 n=1 Tax=Paramacrobiotus metropolitanus TaxID=2943436 RepID=UPI002445E79F|nr:uncharacterized protein LOC129585593 [Paramacrobiotus metropolitanus]XP_055334323.1 uncharacterized protein LOC129585593 [Paramacrobiotus metropolitanus]XP_055334331.1 uncharacterized protein LOC129585593 [Paramacrobiotus metropolitanus]XP_055334339.1 uncharacterized protein LOC129585593 [Paramacrobiotus metropolitanus]XP_055334345.1 uncharacterized protein LOC129585593 [Paramacrobiotus metropolitanus]
MDHSQNLISTDNASGAKKKINSPFEIVREYRNSQYARTTRSISVPAESEERTRKIVITMYGTILTTFISILLESVAVFTDGWGNYRTQTDNGFTVESGRFGLWRVCVEVVRNEWVEKDNCGGTQSAQFTLPSWCIFAGICGVFCLLFLITCFVVAVIQLYHLYRRDPPVCYNRRLLSQKIIPITLSVVCISISLIFAALAVKRVRGAKVTYGSSFYIQIVTIFFVVAALICIAWESLWRPYPSNRPTNSAMSEIDSSGSTRMKSLPKRSFYYKAAKDTENDHIQPKIGDPSVFIKIPPRSSSVTYRRSLSEGATGKLHF